MMSAVRPPPVRTLRRMPSAPSAPPYQGAGADAVHTPRSAVRQHQHHGAVPPVVAERVAPDGRGARRTLGRASGSVTPARATYPPAAASGARRQRPSTWLPALPVRRRHPRRTALSHNAGNGPRTKTVHLQKSCLRTAHQKGALQIACCINGLGACCGLRSAFPHCGMLRCSVSECSLRGAGVCGLILSLRHPANRTGRNSGMKSVGWTAPSVVCCGGDRAIPHCEKKTPRCEIPALGAGIAYDLGRKAVHPPIL